MQIPSLFTSRAGKKYGEQLRELSTFVFACSFLTFPAGKIQDGWLTLFRTGQIEQLRPLTKSEKEYNKLLKFLEVYSEIMDDNDETDFTQVFGRKELRRFLSLLQTMCDP